MLCFIVMYTNSLHKSQHKINNPMLGLIHSLLYKDTGHNLDPIIRQRKIDRLYLFSKKISGKAVTQIYFNFIYLQ